MNEEFNKQWEQDLKDYKDKAHLMYKIPFKTKGLLPLDAPDNSTVVEYFDEVQRKNSAALPFDLERAKAGDVVEYKSWLGKWEIFDLPVNFWGQWKSQNEMRNTDSFRMKYPPKVKP